MAEVSPFAQELTVLLVEDEPVQRTLMAAQLRGVFKEVLLAADGVEGLSRFQASRPQIVLTDHHMPRLSGLELMARIRKLDSRVPIVFITATMTTQLLVHAIQLGVASIVPKPVREQNLAKAIALVVGMLEYDHLQRKTLEQELALLHFRDKYHEFQQELAFRKELSFLENDYLFRAAPGGWLSQVAYHPHDIMCGDSYSLRRLADGSQLIYLADAMGKGLSAALTTSLGVHTFNLQVDALGPFDFAAFVAGYAATIRKRLLEEEVFSFSLAWLPGAGAPLELAAFGMPPILVGSPDAATVQLRCNNPPLAAYDTVFTTTRHDLGQARTLLLYSDGLNEAVTAEGNLYRDHLDADFRATLGGRRFWQAFQARVPAPDDDVTFLLLFRVEVEPLWEQAWELPCRLEAVEQAGLELELRLETGTTLDRNARTEFAMAIREALLNAYEHGSLGMRGPLKQRLLEEGSYHDHLLELEAGLDRPISVRL